MKLLNSNIWNALEAQAKQVHSNSSSIPTRNLANFKLSACNISIDFSHQHINARVLELLISLADQCQLNNKSRALMSGGRVNYSEDRPALHTALRAPLDVVIQVEERNVMEEIGRAKQKMYALCAQIRDQQWCGYSDKLITDIVNIGVGGSDLGPRFCLQALLDCATPNLNYHFISDADPNAFNRVTAKLNPETTLFIISSKSFTTKETLFNAKKAKAWIGDSIRFKHHFIAVTANEIKAAEFGIQTILPIWSWIGGRYSFCSAINLITAIAIGPESFEHMLTGAHDMDKHFHESPYDQNLPALLALFGIWNNNFLNIHNLLMLVYAHQLEQFVPYIQQLDMESNGKSRDNQGDLIHYATGPMIWGGLGNQAQHSFYQLLCQGTHRVTLDLITLETFAGEIVNNMCEAKIKVLSQGVHKPTTPHGFIEGNIPLNHIHLKDTSPYTIGALLALFEHKVFTQSVIWDINPFDQPGVESYKQIK